MRKHAPWIVLFGRTALFLLIQAVVALGFLARGSSTPWLDSAAWWPFTVTAGNLIGLGVLAALFRAEGRSYWAVFRVRRDTLGADLLAMLGVLVVVGPLGYFPNVWLAGWLFGDPEVALGLFIRPLPLWAAYAAIALFPVVHGLVELPLYFAYVMPRLDARPFPDVRPVILPGLMLALQHIAMPLLFDANFILWRAFMFLPFALAVGVVLHWRMRLLPYLVVIHILMDLSLPLLLVGMVY